MPRPKRSSPSTQADLFAEEHGADLGLGSRASIADSVAAASGVAPAKLPDELRQLAAQLDALFGGRLYLGTSSWYFPGWAGLVWADRHYGDAELSRHGLPAYGQHPLLRTVSLDRTFHRAIDAAAYARLARQTPEHFRFLVKVPSEVTDAAVRAPESGAPLIDNPHFLDPQRALAIAVQPGVAGLGAKLGALVFQLSPLGRAWLSQPQTLIDRLDALWQAIVPSVPSEVLVALELRDAAVLTPRLIAHLEQHRVRYCVGLHDRMPGMSRQAQAVVANGSGDFIARWNLHQGLRYQEAKARWEPFDRLQAPDPQTREELAKAIVAALANGHRAFVTVNNKAEGCAPLSVVELAREVLRQAEALR